MTNHFVHEARVHRPTTYSAGLSCSSWRQRARHRRLYDENRSASVTRSLPCFPKEKRSAANSLSGWFELAGMSTTRHDARPNIWRLVCTSASHSSVPGITPTIMHFATCGIRCAMPRPTTPRRPDCDIRRTRESLWAPRVTTHAERRRTRGQYCDSVPSARARRSAYVIASEPTDRKTKQNTASVPTSASTARSGAPSIVTCLTARNP